MHGNDYGDELLNTNVRVQKPCWPGASEPAVATDGTDSSSSRSIGLQDEGGGQEPATLIQQRSTVEVFQEKQPRVKVKPRGFCQRDAVVRALNADA